MARGGRQPASGDATNASQTGDVAEPNRLVMGKSGKVKKKAVSKSEKAGLTFPVSRVNRKILEKKTVKRVGAGAPVFIAALCEHFAAEILDLASSRTREMGRKRLTDEDVIYAIRNDKELHKATAGLRILVGDKQKKASEQLITKHDAEARDVAKEAAKAAALAAA